MWYLILSIVLFTIVNRIRGGGIIKHLPGSGRDWVLLPVASIALMDHQHTWLPVWYSPYGDAALFMVCWWFWAVLPWGPWIALGNEPYPYQQSGAMKWFEDAVNTISGGNAYLALFIRMVCGLFPICILFNPLLMIMAPVMVACYHMGWLIRNHFFPTVDAIAIAELLTGATCWGIFTFAI